MATISFFVRNAHAGRYYNGRPVEVTAHLYNFMTLLPKLNEEFHTLYASQILLGLPSQGG